MYSTGRCALYSAQQSDLCNYIISNDSYIFTLDEYNQPSNITNLFGYESSYNGSVKCQEMILKIVCNYYFAPCGSSSDGIHLPISLCREECESIRSSCSDLWYRVQEIMAHQSFETILCNDTSSRFQGLSPCCSDFKGRVLHLL